MPSPLQVQGGDSSLGRFISAFRGTKNSQSVCFALAASWVSLLQTSSVWKAGHLGAGCSVPLTGENTWSSPHTGRGADPARAPRPTKHHPHSVTHRLPQGGPSLSPTCSITQTYQLNPPCPQGAHSLSAWSLPSTHSAEGTEDRKVTGGERWERETHTHQKAVFEAEKQREMGLVHRMVAEHARSSRQLGAHFTRCLLTGALGICRGKRGGPSERHWPDTLCCAFPPRSLGPRCHSGPGVCCLYADHHKETRRENSSQTGDGHKAGVHSRKSLLVSRIRKYTQGTFIHNWTGIP